MPEVLAQQQVTFLLPPRIIPPFVMGPQPIHPLLPLHQGLLGPGSGNASGAPGMLPCPLPLPPRVVLQPCAACPTFNPQNLSFAKPQQYVPHLPPVQQNVPIGRRHFFQNYPVTVSSSSLSIIPLLTEVQDWTPWNNRVNGPSELWGTSLKDSQTIPYSDPYILHCYLDQMQLMYNGWYTWSSGKLMQLLSKFSPHWDLLQLQPFHQQLTLHYNVGDLCPAE